MNRFMKIAIQEAYDGIRQKHGGPFGTVIVKDGKIVGQGHNCVLKNNDPTAHGEITAIRDACRNLETYDLTGCELYTTAAPCPMCRAAILWSNIARVYYGCSVSDTDAIGFRDGDFYKRLTSDDGLEELDREECLELFAHYKSLDPTIY